MNTHIRNTHSEASVSMLLDSTVLQPGTLTRVTHMSTSVSTRSLDCPPYVRFWDMRDIKLADTHTHTHTQSLVLTHTIRHRMNSYPLLGCVRIWMCAANTYVFVCMYALEYNSIYEYIYIYMCMCMCMCVNVNPLLLLLSLYRTFGPFNMSHNNCDWGLFRIHLNMN